MQEALENLLQYAFENGQFVDAVIAQSEVHRNDLWRIREGVVLPQAFEGGRIKHDILVLISQIFEFIPRANTAMEALIPSVRPVVFGHCGDGNLHYNYYQPPNVTAESFVAWCSEVKKLTHDIVDHMNGSFSVEHGAGQLKKKIGSGTKTPWNWT